MPRLTTGYNAYRRSDESRKEIIGALRNGQHPVQNVPRGRSAHEIRSAVNEGAIRSRNERMGAISPESTAAGKRAMADKRGLESSFGSFEAIRNQDPRSARRISQAVRDNGTRSFFERTNEIAQR